MTTLWDNLLNKEDRLYSFLRFSIIGGVNTVHYYLWYLILLYFGVPYVISHTAGFIMSMIGSFFLNCFFTFKTRPTLMKFIKFPLTTLTNYIVSTLSLMILVGAFSVPKEFAAIFASLLPIPITYILTHKILRNKKPAEAKKLSSKSKGDLISVGILLIFAVASYTVIYVTGTLFARFGTDSTLQYMFFVPFLQKAFLSGQPFFSWSYGLGGDIFGQFSYYYTTSPFFYLGLLIRALGIGNWSLGGVLNWKLLLSIIKEFAVLVSMYALLRDEHHRYYSSLIGAITYGGCCYFTSFTFAFDFMTDAMVWVPLGLLSLRNFRKTRNPIPFIIVAAITVANSFYFGYMSFILFLIYILAFLKPVGENKKAKIIRTIKELLSYGAMFFTAIALSSISFLPSLYALFHSDRFSAYAEYTVLPSAKTVLQYPELIFSYRVFLGLPIIILIVFLLPLKAIKKEERRKTVVAAVFLIMFLTPLSGCFFNGFSYSVERWYYLLVFAIAYALPSWLEINYKGNYVGWRAVALLSASVIVVLFTAKARGTSSSGNTAVDIVLSCLSVLAVVIIVLKKYCKTKKATRILYNSLVFVVALTLLVNNNTALGMRAFCTDKSLLESSGYDNKAEKNILEKLTPTQDEFYRTIGPATDEIENSPMNYGYYGTSAYNSMLDGNLHRWIKRDYNIRNKAVSPSRFSNFDNRLFLESAFGVKYIVNDDKLSSGKVPYGFSFKESRENYSIYQNNYDMGIDLWYDKTIDKETFATLNMGQRDSLLLNAAETSENVSGLEKWYPSDDTKELSSNLENAAFKNSSYNNGTLKAGENSEIDLPLPENSGNGEILVCLNLVPKNGDKFDLTIHSKTTHKEVRRYYYTYPISDFTFCIDGGTQSLKIKISKGEYYLNNFHVYYNSYDNYKALVSGRNKYNLTDLKVHGGNISGVIKNDEKGILALNVPFSEGWSAFVDGKKVGTVKVNGIMTGLVLEKGTHTVTLRYITPWFIKGAVISATALLGVIVFGVYRRKKRRSSLKI